MDWMKGNALCGVGEATLGAQGPGTREGRPPGHSPFLGASNRLLAVLPGDGRGSSGSGRDPGTLVSFCLQPEGRGEREGGGRHLVEAGSRAVESRRIILATSRFPRRLRAGRTRRPLFPS